VSDYDNTNRGALFKNDKEGGNPKWPDYRGHINVDGAEFWLDAWIKDGKKGKFMSLSIKPKVDGGQRKTRDEAPPPDSDIPF
jgi:hypothetical protein